ncbi:hypothetical protein J2S41_005278 [Catenuloplanes atrovinosus]|uniref:Uncharacterized protein n=1 Tax=Catenuloplanes atrovinosus TaxID=137266 RepID=A0AAE3YTS5_9ACTN|nr:hypothetical protein [Catenuloplanes atrovinosus]
MNYDVPAWLGWVIAGVGLLVVTASAILLA